LTNAHRAPRSESCLRVAPRKKRIALYAGINLLFLCAVVVASAIGAPPNPRFLHLVLLFALCSTVVIDLDGLNGRYALLGIFLAAYFVFFGVSDLTNLVDGRSFGGSEGALTSTEAIILVGGLMLVLGYRGVLAVGNTVLPDSRPRDWSMRTILLAGLAIWAIGTYATYAWYVFIVKNNTVESINSGITGISPIATMGYILGMMVQPLGILLIAYAWRAKRSNPLFIIAICMVLLQVVIGFIADNKGLALGGGFLLVLAIMLIDGGIPKTWFAVAALFVYITFPILQAYRTEVVGNHGISRTAVADDLGKALELALSAKDKVNSGTHRAQNFLERLSLKPSVQMIVEGTANGVPFQHGYTLIPVVTTFIPRILWSDKPDIPTGRIVNKVFHVSDQEETYISPSHLGELYWNFGWPGVLIGMTIIGMIFGAIGHFNLAEARTVSRLLVLLLTIQLAVRGFEGSLSNYVVWLRSLAAVGILHVLFARVPVAIRSRSLDGGDAISIPPAPPVPPRVFPNLMA
jgi:hypothetical protein